MRKLLSTSLIVALGSAALPAAAAVVVDVPWAVAEFTQNGGYGDLIAFGAEATSDTLAYSGSLISDLTIDFSLADPIGTANGAVTLWDDSDMLLSGVLSGAAYNAARSVFELTFADLQGSAVGLFGNAVLLEVFFFDGFPALNDGGSYDISYVLVGEDLPQPAPIPLPATGLLLLPAIGALAALRKRKTHAAA